jgi:hypothetical protein
VYPKAKGCNQPLFRQSNHLSVCAVFCAFCLSRSQTKQFKSAIHGRSFKKQFYRSNLFQKLERPLTEGFQGRKAF